MKLNNRQTELVVKMIYDKVKDKNEAERKTEKEKKMNEIKKKLEKTTIVKQLKSIFSTPFVHKIEIYKKELVKYGKDIVPTYNNIYTFSSLEDFYELMIEKKPNNSREIERDLKKNIEEKVLLSMLNTSDLQSLIEAISKEFMK
jgi:hypothetical protein